MEKKALKGWAGSCISILNFMILMFVQAYFGSLLSFSRSEQIKGSITVRWLYASPANYSTFNTWFHFNVLNLIKNLYTVQDLVGVLRVKSAKVGSDSTFQWSIRHSVKCKAHVYWCLLNRMSFEQLKDRKWHHICVTWSGASGVVVQYLDGVKKKLWEGSGLGVRRGWVP